MMKPRINTYPHAYHLNVYIKSSMINMILIRKITYCQFINLTSYTRHFVMLPVNVCVLVTSWVSNNNNYQRRKNEFAEKCWRLRHQVIMLTVVVTWAVASLSKALLIRPVRAWQGAVNIRKINPTVRTTRPLRADSDW